jgi:hypothetical protein
MTKTEVLTAKVPQDMLVRLRRMAHAKSLMSGSNITVSELVRQSICRLLEDEAR